MSKISRLRVARQHTGLSLRAAAYELSMDHSRLHRIETGESRPTVQEARKLFLFYRGEIPLARIHDPDFDEHAAVAA